MHATKEWEDTVPYSVKNFFWSTYEPPKILADYDVIGFDADTGLVRWKI